VKALAFLGQEGQYLEMLHPGQPLVPQGAGGDHQPLAVGAQLLQPGDHAAPGQVDLVQAIAQKEDSLLADGVRQRLFQQIPLLSTPPSIGGLGGRQALLRPFSLPA